MQVDKIHRRYSALYCGAGADVHKNGCLNVPVDGMQAAASCSALLFYQVKHCFFLSGVFILRVYYYGGYCGRVVRPPAVGSRAVPFPTFLLIRQAQ